MYGIVIDDHTDPYVTGQNLDQIRHIAKANERLGHVARVVTEVRDCEYCGDSLPGGWVEIDEYGDFVEQPMHDRCFACYAEERWIDA